MTEKRFTVKQRQGATIYSINDYYGELPLSEGMYYKSNAEKLCKWLNTQHDLLNAFYKENEQLKSENEQLKQDGGYWAETAEARRKEIDKLKEENKQLKQSNKELLLLVDTLKEQNMKFKTRLNDLGVEYYD